MASLKTHTENGELTINLNLTIKIEADGSIRVATATNEATPTKPQPPEIKMDDKFKYEIPDLFEPGKLIDFGKNV